jgi:hypothetical protein
VAEVRQEIARLAGAGAGEPSTPLLGGLFHEVCAGLWDAASGEGWQRIYRDGNLDDAARLPHAVYQAWAGPGLSRLQAALQASAREALDFWTAVEEFCRWSHGLLTAARDAALLRYDARAGQWEGADRLAAVEQELAADFFEPGWRHRVRVSGVADAVLRKPSGEWCVIEYKLGRGAPEADLAQAALYYELLAGEDPKGALALVHFGPGLEERIYTAAQLGDARRKLRRLVGRLAGALPGRPVPSGDRAGAPASSPAWSRLAQTLEQALADHGAPARVNPQPVAGPAFLRFQVEPERGVPVKRALRLATDIQLRLKLPTPPFVQIDNGRLVVDVQREDRRVVPFAEVEAQLPPADPLTGSAWTPVGVDLNGKLRAADLSDALTTHLLVAGTTGSGKSEWLRTALAGLLARNSPRSLRLLLIDPKRNAFAELAASPFLHAPLVYPPEHSAARALENLVDEMERRYARMAGDATITEYARRTGELFPRIVCVCDEYADLILADRGERKRIEELIARLGSKARAAAIHLIIATQQPSRNIIGGPLVANLPARVSLKTNSPIESRMVILEAGAENLLGHGDLLFWHVGRTERLQGALLTAGERERWFGAASLRAAG